jgi:hypothetical protein
VKLLKDFADTWLLFFFPVSRLSEVPSSCVGKTDDDDDDDDDDVMCDVDNDDGMVMVLVFIMVS